MSLQKTYEDILVYGGKLYVRSKKKTFAMNKELLFDFFPTFENFLKAMENETQGIPIMVCALNSRGKLHTLDQIFFFPVVLSSAQFKHRTLII